MLRRKVRQAPVTLILHWSSGEQIECTPEHRFYVEGKGFIAANEIGIGSSIVTRAGPTAKLTRIQTNKATVTVYNFTIQDFHTYFVGGGALWVHNEYDPNAPHYPEPADRGGLRRAAGGNPPDPSTPQMHHELPWKLSDWFGDAPRLMNANDPVYGEWVGSPHQVWTSAYQAAWESFIDQNPLATREEVIEYLKIQDSIMHSRENG